MKKQYRDCVFADEYFDSYTEKRSCGALKEHFCKRGCYQDRSCPFYKSKTKWKMTAVKQEDGSILRFPIKK